MNAVGVVDRGLDRHANEGLPSTEVESTDVDLYCSELEEVEVPWRDVETGSFRCVGASKALNEDLEDRETNEAGTFAVLSVEAVLVVACTR